MMRGGGEEFFTASVFICAAFKWANRQHVKHIAKSRWNNVYDVKIPNSKRGKRLKKFGIGKIVKTGRWQRNEKVWIDKDDNKALGWLRSRMKVVGCASK